MRRLRQSPKKTFDRSVSRYKKIIEFLNAQLIDGILLNSEANVSYAAGFHTPDSYLLATKKGVTVITDFRYTADFQRQASSHINIKEYKGSIFKTIAEAIKLESLKKVGFESRHLTFAECEILNDLFKGSIAFIPLKETIEHIRAIKDADEIANIKKAIAITLEAYSFIEKKLEPGKTELAIAAELERFIRLHGATASAFDIIVASGPNSSYPHATISERVMRKGEPVIIDMGVQYNGYKCDLTRTFFLGKITPLMHRVARIVREAQQRAINIAKPGVLIKDIDASARQYITKNGFAKNFGHALGHGVGLEVHESPSINLKNKHRIKEGMVFTIEPGIYLAGKFGVRIEDMVLVTTGRTEVLSGKHLD